MAEKLKLEVSDEIAIKIQGMNKWFGSFHVLRDIDLTVNRGERIVVCGPSGSGKSTIANELEKKLYENKYLSYLLDGDNIRVGLNKDLGFSDNRGLSMGHHGKGIGRDRVDGRVLRRSSPTLWNVGVPRWHR